MFTLEQFQKSEALGSFGSLLGLKVTSIEGGGVTAVMTVGENHLRPGNIMNGGVSLGILEIVGSMSSFLHINPKEKNAFGIQVSSNHTGMAFPGDVLTSKASPIHIGKTTHIWEINITNQKDKLISTGRITMLVTENK